MTKLRTNKNWSHDHFTDDADMVWKVHKKDRCAGEFCAIHNPSDHALKDAKLIMRTDSFKYGLVERICEHGIGHSDPDSVAWYASIGSHGMGVHGCDGCCTVGGYERLNGSGLDIPDILSEPFDLTGSSNGDSV